MNTIDLVELRSRMNNHGMKHAPFFFVTDFELKENLFVPAEALSETPLHFSFNEKIGHHKSVSLIKEPKKLAEYKKAFDYVISQINLGNSFLVNLTQPNVIKTDLTIQDIFENSTARYKLLWEDRFVVFSPEPFVRIFDGKISSYPMKGTISGSIPNAREILLSDVKESAEHATIVDLIRNDLSINASNVKVEKFKYLETIKTSNGDIIQMSSKITGELKDNYQDRIGDIVIDMLPAGSISGAPKNETLKIIKKAENYERGFYCGVAGHFDGTNLESFVMIRFIENGDQLIYKSGGGITSKSILEDEYQEMIDKIYVPVH